MLKKVPKAKNYPEMGSKFLDMYILVVFKERKKSETAPKNLLELMWNHPQTNFLPFLEPLQLGPNSRGEIEQITNIQSIADTNTEIYLSTHFEIYLTKKLSPNTQMF